MSNQLQENLDAILLDKNTNLKPENLKEGITCLGIEGTMQPGLDTSDANAIETDIIQDKTAYVNGQKITGTMAKHSETVIGKNISIGTIGTPTSVSITSHISQGYYPDNTAVNFKFHQNPTTEDDKNICAAMVAACDIMPEYIMAGKRILSSKGTATSDANASASDIAQDKTAYVNGEKITGTLKKLFELSYIVNNMVWTDETDLDQLRLDIPLLGDGIVTSNQTKTVVILHYDKLAEEIGLTADKIKAGETILGITGTYTGEIDISL